MTFSALFRPENGLAGGRPVNALSLPAQALFTAAIARPARAIRFEPGFSAGSLVRLPRLQASPHPPDLIPDILQRCGDGGIERKIGRASCRERVWQYV